MKLKNILTGTLLVAGLAGTFGCEVYQEARAYQEAKKEQKGLVYFSGQVTGQNFQGEAYITPARYTLVLKTEEGTKIFIFSGYQSSTIDALIEKGDSVDIAIKKIDIRPGCIKAKNLKKENILSINSEKFPDL